jgi:hypothetical protein
VRGTTYLGNINITLNNLDYILNQTYTNNWHELGNIFLKQGSYNLTINSQGIFTIDQISLYNNLKDATHDNKVIDYKSINSCKHIVDVNISEPGYLLFVQSYHPLWRCYIKGKEILPEKQFGFINGFYLSDTGEYRVSIEFLGQRYLLFGTIISLLTILIIIIKHKWETIISKLTLEKKELIQKEEQL